ncbi:MAG: 4Fe-4S cluster-binding domain-containing protein [Lachnospiraceae bacterium]|nr:4Fe-4S cluster-binding domain-containing protein [Lachnospiraceae bacterium]MCM1373307.1 4Fe-4S cluster-binding domain-containing protein [Bacteroides sp.]
MLLVTYSCNLRCSYCYEPKESNFHMTVERTKRIIREQMSSLKDDYDSVEIQFMGGEPLLEFSLIKEISEWLWSSVYAEKLLALFAPTNGTLLNDEMKEWFTVNKEKIHLGLSFDGDDGMQNANRSNSFKNVDLAYFATTWPEQSVKMTISPETISRMSDGVEYLHEMGFKYISADLAMGSAIQWSKQSLISFRNELSTLSQYYLIHTDLIPFSMLRVNIESVGKSSTHVKTCSCGEDMVCVDWTGKEYACHLFSPVSISMKKAVRSNLHYDFKDHSQFESPICAKCLLNTACNHCYGMNYICTNDVRLPSPFHCSAFRILFAENCKFRLALAEKQNDLEAINIINKAISKIA